MAARTRARPARPGRRRGRVAVRPPDLRDLLRRRHRGGRLGRGLRDRRRPAARQPHRDLRRQPDLDRGQHRHRAGRGRRRRATRPTAGTSRPSTGPTTRPSTPRTSPRSTTRSRQGRRGHRPAQLHRARARSSPGPRPTPRTPARPTAPRSVTDEVAATKKVLGFDPDQTFEVPPGVLEHTRELVARGKAGPGRLARSSSTAWATGQPRARRRSSTGCRPATLPDGLGRRPADLRRRPQGRGHPQGLRRRSINAIAAAGAGALGRLGRPGRVQQHHHRGRPVVPARRPLHRRCGRATPTPAGCCTSASASTAWARSSTASPSTAAPASSAAPS